MKRAKVTVLRASLLGACGVVGVVGVCGAVGLAGVLGLSGCEGFATSSKVARGERYRANDGRYQSYFETVHQQQAAIASWPKEKSAARRPLANALALPPDASDSDIVAATRHRAKKRTTGRAQLDVATARVTTSRGATDASLNVAIEETARLELERSRRLKSAHDRLAELAKRGEELQATTEREHEARRRPKPDAKGDAKHRELLHELDAATSSMHALARKATDEAAEAQEFLDDLAGALGPNDSAKSARGRARSHDGRSDPKPTLAPHAGARPASAAGASPSAGPAPTSSAPAPPPSTPRKTPRAEEIFNP